MKPGPLFFVLLIFLLGPSCEKKTAVPGDRPLPVAPAIIYPSYSQLKIGNYWIYSYYKVDNNGSTLTDRMDSSYVEKDTVIHQSTFFKLHRHEFSQPADQNYYLRDSLNYIIDQTGKILFASADFSGILYTYAILAVPSTDSLYKVSVRMTARDSVIQVPAGTFTTSDLQSTYLTYPRYHTSRASDVNYTNARYAKYMGLITETEPIIFEASYVTERRLLRYHLH